MKVSELATALGGRLEGDGDIDILGTAAIDGAKAGELAYIGGINTRAILQAQMSNASCVLIPDRFPGTLQRTVIRVPHTRAAFVSATALLREPDTHAPGVHPTALVAPDAHIDSAASVGPYVIIGPGCSIGRDSSIGAHSVLGSRIVVGRNCRIDPKVVIYDDVDIGSDVNIYAGAVIGASGFGYEYIDGRLRLFPQHGKVSIGDRVDIGANTCIDRGLSGTEIGHGTKIDNLVHIGHNCHVGSNVAIAAQAGLSGGVIIEDNVLIGGQVGIGEGARICSGVKLGGQTGVYPRSTIAVQENQSVFTGTPARPRWRYLRQLLHLDMLVARTSRTRRGSDSKRDELFRSDDERS